MYKMTNIDIYYFSGTGNTKLIVDKMKDCFNANNFKTNLYKIEKSNPEKINLKNTIGLAFPVAFQSTYKFIWDFIYKMPATRKKTIIFMVDTLHLFSGGIVGPLKQIFKNKGYNTIGAKEIIMPNNLYPQKINVKKNKIKIAKGLKKAEKYTYELINNKSKWINIPLLPYMLHKVSSSSFLLKKSNELGKRYKIDKNRCTKCGICINLCPVQNIIMNDYPIYLDKCQLCQRCMIYCPENAISFKFLWKFKKYKAIELDELLK
ncbi:MAG: EFR1 family ferrodoxin [Spirochaetes bacterium]|nr:EFR1 family ferrodoxin [Spirochaetota bacterium]